MKKGVILEKRAVITMKENGLKWEFCEFQLNGKKRDFNGTVILLLSTY